MAAADTPIFQTLLTETAQQQIIHEEAFLTAWLAAVIATPKGRAIIERLLK